MEYLEIWKDIPGYESRYQVSSYGRVKSLSGKKYSRYKGDHVLRPNISVQYEVVCLCDIRGKKRCLVHRLVASAFLPNSENKPCINHINSIRSDNRIENLEWCTYSENNLHAYASGNQKRQSGESHPGSKLTQKEVEEIRAKYIPRVCTITILSEEYGVTKGHIHSIIKRITWK